MLYKFNSRNPFFIRESNAMQQMLQTPLLNYGYAVLADEISNTSIEYD